MVDLRLAPTDQTLEERAYAHAYARYRRDAIEALGLQHRSLPIDSMCSSLAQEQDISLSACMKVWAGDIRERRVYVWETAGNLDAHYIRRVQETPPDVLPNREEECLEELYGEKTPDFDRQTVLEELAAEYPFARKLLRGD